MILLTTFFFSLCALFVYSLWTYSYWKKRKVVYPRPVPLFGNIKNIALLRQYPGLCYQDIYRMFPEERYVGLFLLHRPGLLIRDPELVKQVLVKDFEYFFDRGIHFNEEREPLTANLISLTGSRWKNLRAKLTPAFSSGKIKNMFPLLQQCSEQLRMLIQSQLKGGDVMELRELTSRFTTDVIGTVAFGLQFEAMNGEPIFRSMGKKVLKTAALAMAMRAFTPWLFDLMRMRTIPKEVNDFFIDLVYKTIKERIDTGYQRNDFLQLMIQLKEATMQQEKENKGDFEFTDSVIAAQAYIFFLAGFETSATTLSYCLHELAKHPECQQKVLDEIIDVVTRYNGLTYDGVAEMPYLEQVLLETLRIYPPAGYVLRICTKEYQVPESELVLEKGVGVVIPVYALHHDPLLWADPEAFKPERFADRDLQKAPFFLPFGTGPRICIGQRFAMTEMKIALATLLQNFSFSLSDRSHPVLAIDPKCFITAPKDGVWLKVTPRSSNQH